MQPEVYYIILCIVCILVILYTNHVTRDHFQSKREKAEFIQKHAYPLLHDNSITYDKYKKLVKNTDSVEYYDVKNAYKKNQFDANHLEQVVNV